MSIKPENKDTVYNRIDIDGGKITDPTEIAKYKNTQRIDVIENYLLGDFNESGGYILAEDLMKELVVMPKILRYNYNKTNFASSLEIKGFGRIEFAIKVYVDTPIKGEATAALTLLEPINKVNGYYQNTNSVALALYKGLADESFISNVFESFNLKTEEDETDGSDGDGKKIVDIQDIKDIPTITARKRYLLSVKDKLSKSLNVIEKEYYTSRMELLKKDPSIGLVILEEVALQEAKIKDLFLQGEGSGSIYKDLNELLDSVIENHPDEMAKLDPEIKTSLNDKTEKFIDKTEAIIEESKNAVVKKAKGEDKKSVKQEAIKQQLNEKKEAAKKPVSAKPDKGQAKSSGKSASAPTFDITDQNFNFSIKESNEKPSKTDAVKEVINDVKPEPAIETKNIILDEDLKNMAEKETLKDAVEQKMDEKMKEEAKVNVDEKEKETLRDSLERKIEERAQQVQDDSIIEQTQ